MKLRGISKLLLVATIVLILFYIFHKGSLSNSDSDSDSEVFYPSQSLQSDWQKVTGTCCHFIVYSAYAIVDRYPKEEVTVIGVTRTFRKNNQIYCRFYYPHAELGAQDGEDYPDESYSLTGEGNSSSLNFEDVPGTIETMLESWGRFYAGAFIRCPLPSWKPAMVSIIPSPELEPTNMVPIQYKSEPRGVPASQQYNYTFSVCVHPIYNFDEVYHLIEWIEFYKLMGVEQFTLYNVSIGPAASCILHDLMEGSDPSIKVNVHPWHNVPITNKYLMRGRCTKCALSAGSNDCLYRHRGRLSKYMVFVDLDEYIMPREHIAKNYSQLIDYIDAQKPSKDFGYYLFQNGFYMLDKPDDPMLLERCSPLQYDPLKHIACLESFFMAKATRDDYFPIPKRTKYIIKPEGVSETGTHYPLRLEYGYDPLNVSTDIGFSRHYRLSHPGILGKHSEFDRVSKEFGLQLVENVASKLEYFIDKCQLKVELESDTEPSSV